MSYPCPECHRQFGDGERCQHCDYTPPPSSREQSRAAVEAIRRTLAEIQAAKKAGKQGTIGLVSSGSGAAQTARSLADPSREGADVEDDTRSTESGAF